MKISLLHPSRGRPEKSFNTVIDWIEKSSVGKSELEVIVSIDSSDTVSDYEKTYNATFCGGIIKRFGFDFYGIVNDNKCVVEATNHAAKHSTGDILVYLSEDFKAPDNWDELITKELENENRPLLIKVDDCLQGFDVPVLTIPIMNRALYEKLGYFWHPEYKSMHVDVDLYYTCMNIGAIKKCRHLKFPHEHHSVGKADNDETYRRSEANWNQGLEVFNRRKRMKFPI